MGTAAGTRLGPYEMLALIGRGGMGEVWKARDTRLGRLVAIKRLSAEHSRRFANEAQAIAALNHPHICTLHDIGPDYLVMEYVEGVPLQGPMPATEAVRIGLQIADALREAHSKGILHCDLKPANVLLMPNRASVKLLDFGLAKLLADFGWDVTHTIDARISGTAAYMSPEQAQGTVLDERSDVFSFGAVLYELLSGRPAFGGKSVAESLSAVLRDEPQPLAAPHRLGQIVNRCLRKSRTERFSSMQELIAALEGVRQSDSVARSQPSIAVLPFANMSADKDEYFSDGLAEEIINALTRMEGLKVTARTSAFAFRGRDVDIPEIARKLNVEYVLEGSVRKAASRVRITAQLIKAADGFHLWSERYDRQLTDIFELQDEISAAIAGQLKVKLLPGAMPPKRSPKLAAYEAYLESRYHWQKFNPASFAKSLECVQRALAIDPEYSDAYVGLAAYYFSLAWYGAADPRDVMPKAQEAALRALELDQSSPAADAVVGAMKGVFEYDWAEAGQHFARALAVDRGLYVALSYANWHLRPLGRLEEALAELESLRQSDPLSPAARSEMAHVLLLMRRWDEAAEAAQQALDLEQDYMLALFTLLTVRVEQKRFDEAVATAERTVQFAGRWLVPLTYLGYAYAAAGRRSEARAVLAEMQQFAASGHTNATAFANICTALGEIDAAVEWLDRAIDQREPVVILLKHWCIFDRVRNHPRYPGLLARMRLG